MTFGEILKRLRNINKITQSEFAQVLNKSRSTIAGYEINDRLPDQETMLKISECFGVSLENLIKISENDTSILEHLGGYINGKISDSYTIVKSVSELSNLTNIPLDTLNKIIDGSEIPTREQIKLIAIFGPFKYIDLLANSIYGLKEHYSTLHNIKNKSASDYLRIGLVDAMNFYPTYFYQYLINFYNQTNFFDKNSDYFDLVDSFALETLHYYSLEDNEAVIKNMGFSAINIESGFIIVPSEYLEEYILRVFNRNHEIGEQHFINLENLPNEAILEIENFVEYIRQKYRKTTE